MNLARIIPLRPRMPIVPSRQFGNDCLRIVGKVLFALANICAALVLLGMVVILCLARQG